MDKRQFTEIFLKEAGISYTEDELEKYVWRWWINPVSKTSLRLSNAGFDFLTQQVHLECYTYKLHKDYRTTSKALLQMGKYLTTPFYLYRQTITFFGERDAIMLALSGNNLAQYLDNFTR